MSRPTWGWIGTSFSETFHRAWNGSEYIDDVSNGPLGGYYDNPNAYGSPFDGSSFAGMATHFYDNQAAQVSPSHSSEYAFPQHLYGQDPFAQSLQSQTPAGNPNSSIDELSYFDAGSYDHLIERIENGRYRCLDCGYDSERKSNVTRHVKATFKSDTIRCAICGVSIARKDNIDSHYTHCHPSAKRRCAYPDCTRYIFLRPNEQKELCSKKHTNFVCSCGKAYTTKDDLNRHKRSTGHS